MMFLRYYRRSDERQLASHFGLKQFPDDVTLAPDFNIAPGSVQPVVCNELRTNARQMVMMCWGLLSSFVADSNTSDAFNTNTARAETLLNSSTFCRAFESRRCLIPVDGFYAWKGPCRRRQPHQKPYAFSMRSGESFALAGLWEERRNNDGASLQSFAIVTTQANELVVSVTERMPAILYQKDWDEWLERGSLESPPMHLLRPFDARAMVMRPCNPALGDLSRHGPEMLACPEASEALHLPNSA